MRLQYAAEVDWTVEKSLKTPLRLQYAHAAMSSFTHFIHTNTSSIFSQSLVYGSGRSRENVAGSITSTGGRYFHGGKVQNRKPAWLRLLIQELLKKPIKSPDWKHVFFSFFWAQTRSFKEPIVSQKVTMKEEHPFKEQLNIICLGGGGGTRNTIFSQNAHLLLSQICNSPKNIPPFVLALVQTT